MEIEEDKKEIKKKMSQPGVNTDTVVVEPGRESEGGEGGGDIVMADRWEPVSSIPWVARWEKHLNFFRIHLLVFTFFPLLCSILFWAVNGRYKIAYIDAVFLCYSAFTNTGLASVDLSRTTPLQQAILYIQMFCGSIIVVAWVVVLVRKNIMARHCAHWVAQRNGFTATARNAIAVMKRGKTMNDLSTMTQPDPNLEEKGFPSFQSEPLPSDHRTTAAAASSSIRRQMKKKRASTGAITPYRKASIHRVDTGLRRVDPSGKISREPTLLANSLLGQQREEKKATGQASGGDARGDAGDPHSGSFFDTIPATPGGDDERDGGVLTSSPKPFVASPKSELLGLPGEDGRASIDERLSPLDDPNNGDGDVNSDQHQQQLQQPAASPVDREPEQQELVAPSPSGPRFTTSPLPLDQTFATARQGQGVTPTTATPRTVGFNVPTSPRAAGGPTTTGIARPSMSGMRQRGPARAIPERKFTYSEIDVRRRSKPLRKTQSYQMPVVDNRFVTKTSIGFGGFPGPLALSRRLWAIISHRLDSSGFGKIFRPSPSILLPTGATRPKGLTRNDTKQVPYLSFLAVLGKNSAFHGLTEEELDELGGVEYRGLSLLSTLVPAYYIIIQAFSWIIFSTLFSKSKYDSLFLGQWRFVQPSWAGVFMGTSAMTNTGMSLVDTALIPFQSEFGVLIMTSFNSLVGNTAFPILLRFIIWIGTKVRSESSEAWATLHFLLDHPRRCFLYLFPSHQTWFLLTIIFALNMIDWAGFMLFDLGNHVLETIPLNQRVINGFLQATSVRCAGVASVSLSLLAPATQVLFIIMMYIAPYPIALAVRSTNVYQDRSLGVYEEEDDSDEEEEQEEEFRKRHKSAAGWGTYLAFHAKRQLAYDIWWLVGAWLLVVIFERSKIWDPATRQFDLFGVSAYSSVGLSLGLSNANYSLSGAWSVPSKLVVVLVMIRGRSRGLPVAIDRAVMLPKEMMKTGIAKRRKTLQAGGNFQQDPKAFDTIHEKGS
ncbi:low affinity potassium transporter [Serendipita sp. 399]|nr:low affinity potassium transporter [Serendipita sp. 399]